MTAFVIRKEIKNLKVSKLLFKKKMLTNGILFLFLIAMTMAGSNDNVAAFASSDSGKQVPRLSAPDPEKNLPTIKLGETIRFEQFGYVANIP